MQRYLARQGFQRVVPPFGSTDIIECSGTRAAAVKANYVNRHSVALILSSAAPGELERRELEVFRHSVALILSSAAKVSFFD